jgi:Ser/Thr protein kinase RdoA (MazF antagonist)
MNLVFGQDGVHKVLEFNCCFNDIRLWDLSYTALSFGGKETVGPLQDPNEAAAFIRAYHRHSPLSDHEWSLLPDFLSFVFVKLMTAATSSWWINEKFSSLRELLTGQAKYIRDRAQSQD